MLLLVLVDAWGQRGERSLLKTLWRRITRNPPVPVGIYEVHVKHIVLVVQHSVDQTLERVKQSGQSMYTAPKLTKC